MSRSNQWNARYVSGKYEENTIYTIFQQNRSHNTRLRNDSIDTQHNNAYTHTVWMPFHPYTIKGGKVYKGTLIMGWIERGLHYRPSSNSKGFTWTLHWD